jgi:hypothetical protein
MILSLRISILSARKFDSYNTTIEQVTEFLAKPQSCSVAC